MSRSRRDSRPDLESAYPAWKAEALKALQHQHDIAPGAIPERVWTNLFVRSLNPEEAAGRAEVYYRNIQPAGLQWRKQKNER
jgi:hypothetical protein